MRRGIQRAKSEMGAVFFVTVGISLAFVLWGVFFSQSLLAVAAATFQFVVRDLSWFYLIPTNLFLIFVVYLAFSSLVAIFLLWIYFVAGADAGTIVHGRMSAGSVLNPSPATKLTWWVVMALFAAVLLYIGGFEALQQASVLAGMPFTIVMLLMCWSLYKSIREDARKEGLQEEPQGEQEPEDRAARKPAGEPASSPGK